MYFLLTFKTNSIGLYARCSILTVPSACCQQSPPFRPVLHHLEEVHGDWQAHQHGCRPWCDRRGCLRFLFRSGSQDALRACQAAPVSDHLPPHRGNRPSRLREPECRDWCIWRGLRPDQVQGKEKRRMTRFFTTPCDTSFSKTDWRGLFYYILHRLLQFFSCSPPIFRPPTEIQPLSKKLTLKHMVVIPNIPLIRLTEWREKIRY